MGIWKNRDKRKALKRGHRRELQGLYEDNPHIYSVETEEQKELRRILESQEKKEDE